MKKTRDRTEYGDWQTPIGLAREVCRLLAYRGISPCSVLEPTCGKGAFLVAAAEVFPMLTRAVGVEINKSYLENARAAISAVNNGAKIELLNGDFFRLDWYKIAAELPDPILVLGNPPWVTNSAIGAIKGKNLPEKMNVHNGRGIEAITGKSNFDISEWMLLHAIDLVKDRAGTVSMLCKTAVARKVLTTAWRRKNKIESAAIYNIDAKKHFDASVSACLLVIQCSSTPAAPDCLVYDSLRKESPETTIGLRENRIVADVKTFEKLKGLMSKNAEAHIWRSGIKHDCADVMELLMEGNTYRNGLGELVDIEEELLYPMLKSSDLAKGPPYRSDRRMLVTQNFVGESTDQMKYNAPKAWRYLTRHADLLSRRGSQVYKGQPSFAVFGVGPYSFAPWKVAVSGFNKNVVFRVVGPRDGKPVVLDDTCYFIACPAEEQAEYLAELLNSDTAGKFFSCFIFMDTKRPVTLDVLSLLDISSLAKELTGSEIPFKDYRFDTSCEQLTLFK